MIIDISREREKERARGRERKIERKREMEGEAQHGRVDEKSANQPRDEHRQFMEYLQDLLDEEAVQIHLS